MRATRTATGALTLLISVFVRGENLVVNPGFDTSLSGWYIPPNQTPQQAVWDSGNGALGSGSAKLFVPTNEFESRLWQCVPVVPGRPYDFSAWMTGQPCRVEANFSSSLGCTDGVGTPVKVYESLPTRRGLAPLAARSALVIATCDTGLGSGGIVGHFDDVQVQPVVRGDLDGDGQADLLLRHAVTNEHVLWRMSGIAKLETLSIAPQPEASQVLVGVAELSGDQRSDLLFQDSDSGEISFWEMDGPTRVGAPHPLDQQPDSNLWRVEAVDLGWGAVMAVLRNVVTQELRFWVLSGKHVAAQFTGDPAQAPGPEWILAGFAELGASASSYRADLLWFHTSTHGAATGIWSQTGISGGVVRFDHHVLATRPLSNGNGWRPVAVLDLGPGPGVAYGTADILWQLPNGKLHLWYMDANGQRVGGVNLEAAGDWVVAGPR